MKKFTYLLIIITSLLSACSEDISPSDENVLGPWTLAEVGIDCGPSIDCISSLDPSPGQYTWTFKMDEGKLIVENALPDLQGTPLLASGSYNFELILGENKIKIDSDTYGFLVTANSSLEIVLEAPSSTSPVIEYIFHFDLIK